MTEFDPDDFENTNDLVSAMNDLAEQIPGETPEVPDDIATTEDARKEAAETLDHLLNADCDDETCEHNRERLADIAQQYGDFTTPEEESEETEESETEESEETDETEGNDSEETETEGSSSPESQDQSESEEENTDDSSSDGGNETESNDGGGSDWPPSSW